MIFILFEYVVPWTIFNSRASFNIFNIKINRTNTFVVFLNKLKALFLKL